MIHKDNISQRQAWMAVLSKAACEELAMLWGTVSDKPSYELLRKPETGLVMVRGRMGGTGKQFNTGEATVTRCCVRSDSGKTGHAYILGRDHKHARLAAEVDAALQQDENREGLMNSIIMPLAEQHEAKLNLHRKKVAATKVDFFTLVRGEDE